LQYGDALTEEQVMEVVKETDVLNEVRCSDHCFARWAQRSGIGVKILFGDVTSAIREP
jgi:hypothetical protein